jgi:hypothetical protein
MRFCFNFRRKIFFFEKSGFRAGSRILFADLPEDQPCREGDSRLR